MATLTNSYQYIGRTNPITSSGGFDYYVLLYALTNGNITTGKHRVTVLMRMACFHRASFYGYGSAGYVKVNGSSAISWSNEKKPGAAWNGEITVNGVRYQNYIDLGEGYIDVDAGWGKTNDITISISWQRVESVSSVPYYLPPYQTEAKGSFTVTLPMIPGATKITSLSSATGFVDGPISYSYTPLSASLYTKRIIEALGADGKWITIHTKELGQKAATTQRDTAQFNEQEQNTIYGLISGDAKEAKFRLSFQTFTDSGYKTKIGDTQSQEITLKVPENSLTKPTVTEMVVSAVSALCDVFSGLYIQSKTKVAATIAGAGKFNASVVSYSLQVEGKTYTGKSGSITSGYLMRSGTQKLIGTVTDSRGFTNTVEATVQVLGYYRPTFAVTDAYRCLSDGQAADNGEFLYIKASAACAPVEGNICSISMRYKAEGGRYGEELSVTEDGVVDGVELNTQKGYTVQIIARDLVGEETSTTFTIPSEAVFQHKPAGGRSLGLGGYVSEDNTLEVHWKGKFRKGINGVYIQRVGYNAGNTLQIKTKFPALDETYSPFQVFWLMGVYGTSTIHGALRVRIGDCHWSGTGAVTAVCDDEGKATVTLPGNMASPLLVISADPFEITE